MVEVMAVSQEVTVHKTVFNYEQYINPTMVRLFRLMGLSSVAQEASGCIITDQDGKEYIDCLGGYGVFSLGHRHPKVMEAVKLQLDKMPLSSKMLFDESSGELAALLSAITPGDLQYSFFGNSGTEAVEGALKLARVYTGRKKIIATVNSFHGKTLGALSASGRDLYREPFQPLLTGFVHVPFGVIDAVETAIDADTAAIIVEPIQGEGGIILPPDKYLPALRNLCDSYGTLLIADEVQTGLGRTGAMFACDHYGVTPDILTTAKALGGGIMPISAFTARPNVWEPYIKNPFLHTSTFGGNPLACAAALAAISVVVEEGLCQQSAEKGEYLVEGLKKISDDFPGVIREVRGKGLLIGVELCEEGIGGVIMSELVNQGILVAYTLNNPKVMRIEPPLIISFDLIDQVLDAFDTSVEVAYNLLDDL